MEVLIMSTKGITQEYMDELFKRVEENAPKAREAKRHHEEQQKIDMTNFKKLAMTLESNIDNTIETKLRAYIKYLENISSKKEELSPQKFQTYIRNYKVFSSVRLNKIVENVCSSCDCAKSSCNSKIGKVIQNAYDVSAFTTAVGYKKVPFKYQGLVYTLLVEMFDKKTTTAKICSSSKNPSFSDLYSLYTHVFDIVNKFKENNKQECVYDGDVLFSEPFFTVDDMDYILKLNYIENHNYSKEEKDLLSIVTTIMQYSKNDVNILDTARTILKDDKSNGNKNDIDKYYEYASVEKVKNLIDIFLEDYSVDSNAAEERLKFREVVFDDEAFIDIIGNIARGYFYTIQEDLTQKIKDYMDIMFFCDHKNIEDMYTLMNKITQSSLTYSEKAEKKIKKYIEIYQNEYAGYREEQKQQFREKVSTLKREIRQSEIAKELFKQCEADKILEF